MAKESGGDNWKWWYYIVAGLLIGAFGIFQFTQAKIGKAIGSEILAVLLIVVGLFSMKSESAKE